MEDGIQIQAKLSEVAWASRCGDEEVQDVHLRERVFLARTQNQDFCVNSGGSSFTFLEDFGAK